MKTECKKTREDLSAYTDGMLNEKDQASVFAHLTHCAECRQELSTLQDLVKAIGRVPAEQAPADFSNRLRQRIEAESPLQRLFRRLFVPLRVKLPIELVTAAALGVAIFFVIQPTDTGQKADDMSLKITGDRQKQPTGSAPSILETKETPISAPGGARKTALRDKSAGFGETADGLAKTVPEKRTEQVSAPQPAPPANEMENRAIAAPASDSETGSLGAPERLSGAYEPIELTLFIGSAPRPSAAAGSLAEAPETVSVPEENRSGRRTLADRRFTAQELQATEAAGKDKERSSIPETPGGRRPMETAAARVRELVAGLGGTVSTEGHYTDSPFAAFLEIEIPAASYDLFCRRLQSLGGLKDSPPDIDSAAGTGVRIHLELLTRPNDPPG